MNRLEVGVLLVNQAVIWILAHVHPRLERVVEVAHRIAGGLILLSAPLLVLTARPRWRSRAGAVVVALALTGIVVAGWAPHAVAGTVGTAQPPARQSQGGGVPVGLVAVVAVVLVVTMFRGALRVAWFVVRAVLVLLGVLRLVAVLGGAVAAAVLFM
jgi:hypothetical protein